MFRLLLGLFSSLVLLLGGILAWYTLDFFFIPLPAQQTTLINVKPGESMASVAADLGKKGLLKHPEFFSLMIKLQGHSNRVKSGEYLLEANMTPDKLMSKLVRGKVVLHKITFIEGWTFAQMLHAIKDNPYLSHTLTDESPEAIMTSIGHAGEDPEGRFYPDTFLFASYTKDSRILQMSYDLMQKKLLHAWEQREADLPYKDPYQALVVASLIEKETGKASERPLIAGVILKRLQMGMRLQIDASVIYGAGQNYNSKLTKTNLRTDTDYNTYTRNGLPPTPIAMPSISSIEAALHPKITQAIYYVAKGDGSHVFSSNLQAHHAAVERYLVPVTNNSKNPAVSAVKESTSVELMLDLWPSIGGSDIFAICSSLPLARNAGG